MRTLIIIHGWAYSIAPWEKTVAQLRKRGIAVEQLHVPGLTIPTEHAWTIEEYVAWLHEQLAGRKDIVVLGHSNGGRIAMHYLAQYPRAFSQLILLNAAGLYYPAEVLSWRRRLARCLAKIGKPLGRIPLVKKAFYRLIKSDYGHAPRHMQQTLTNMLESDKHFNPELVKVDKLFMLWGRNDRVTPIGMGRKLQQQLQGARLREFDEWGHAPYITHPDELARAIEEVL